MLFLMSGVRMLHFFQIFMKIRSNPSIQYYGLNPDQRLYKDHPSCSHPIKCTRNNKIYSHSLSLEASPSACCAPSNSLHLQSVLLPRCPITIWRSTWDRTSFRCFLALDSTSLVTLAGATPAWRGAAEIERENEKINCGQTAYHNTGTLYTTNFQRKFKIISEKRVMYALKFINRMKYLF